MRSRALVLLLIVGTAVAANATQQLPAARRLLSRLPDSSRGSVAMPASSATDIVKTALKAEMIEALETAPAANQTVTAAAVNGSAAAAAVAAAQAQNAVLIASLSAAKATAAAASDGATASSVPSKPTTAAATRKQRNTSTRRSTTKNNKKNDNNPNRKAPDVTNPKSPKPAFTNTKEAAQVVESVITSSNTQDNIQNNSQEVQERGGRGRGRGGSRSSWGGRGSRRGSGGMYEGFYSPWGVYRPWSRSGTDWWGHTYSVAGWGGRGVCAHAERAHACSFGRKLLSLLF